MWIEEGIPCINLTPYQYNVLIPANVNVSNITIPVNCMTSQMNTIATQRTLLWGLVNVLKSMDRCSNITRYFFMYMG